MQQDASAANIKAKAKTKISQSTQDPRYRSPLEMDNRLDGPLVCSTVPVPEPAGKKEAVKETDCRLERRKIM